MTTYNMIDTDIATVTLPLPPAPDIATVTLPLPLAPQFTVSDAVFEDEVMVPPVMLHWYEWLGKFSVE